MYKIYGIPISVHTRKVIFAAIEKKLVFEVDPVIPFNPPAGWDDLSPTGKIPILSDDYMTLADSSVICTYLERLHPRPALYPADTADHVQALWFEEYCDGTLFPTVVHGLFFQNVIRPNILKEQTDKAAVEKILDHNLPKAFGYLEKNMQRDYLVGNQLSMADVALTSNLLNYHYLGYTIDQTRWPRLAAHFARLVRQPSFAQALALEAPVVRQMGLTRVFLDRLAA